ncbi:MAG: hypothetical protein JRJ14_08705, partial [Deltaproteobacteria bacterium]|nr:hypothetical protein [Deltaproteobacteria bacterium]
CRTNVLILPKDLDAQETPGTAKLNMEDAIVLLRKIDELATDFEATQNVGHLEDCRKLSDHILKNVSPEIKSELLGRVRSAKIMGGVDCRLKRRRLLSVKEISLCQFQGLLFLFSQGTTDAERLGLAKALQELTDSSVIVINSDTAKLVFGAQHGLTSCHAEACLKALGSRPLNLTVDGHRSNLIQELAGASLNQPDLIRGMRYLLHGQSKHFNDDHMLWTRGYQQSLVWEKLWRQLPGNSTEGWNLLERTMIEQIPQNKWSALKICEIKSQDILNTFREKGFCHIDVDLFSRLEREEVLMAAENDGDLWKMIPFHETVSGTLTAITSQNVFLESDLSLPIGLQDVATFILRSINERIRRSQESNLRQISNLDLVQIILGCQKPSKYWLELMNALQEIADLSQLGPDFGHQLRKTPWLIDREDNPTRPSDVINLKPLQDEVSRITARPEAGYCDPTKLKDDLCNHPFFNAIKRRYFSADESGLERLGTLIAGYSDYAIGNIDISLDMIQPFGSLMKNAPSDIDLSGWPLVVKVCDAYGVNKCETYILPNVIKPIQNVKINNVLKWLKTCHKTSNRKNQEEILALFNCYLKVFATTENASKHLSELELLNQKKRWKPSAELCDDIPSVDESFLLDGNQSQILRKFISRAIKEDSHQTTDQNQLDDIEVSSKATARKLRDYFKSWGGLVSPEIICAFLSLIGDDKELLSLARTYQGYRSIEGLKDRLIVDDYSDSYKKCKFAVKIINTDTIRAISIIGKQITVPLKKKFDSLIVGDIFSIGLTGLGGRC